MHIKKHTRIIIGTSFLSLLLLTGCGQSTAPVRQKQKIRQTQEKHEIQKEHEILTLEPVSPEKTVITLKGLDGVDLNRLEQGIEAHFPNVDIVQVCYGWIANDLMNEAGEDILLHQNLDEMKEFSSYMVNLTTEPYLQNYYLSSLWDCEIDGNIYFLPGPTHIYGIVYNKDMFTRQGWQIPSNLDEFIQLCQTIEASGTRSLQPALYYRDAMRQFITGFSYYPVFYGLENHEWYTSYMEGNASLSGHFEPALDNLRQLSDAGILRPEDFTMRPSIRSDMMYTKQNCAMVIETQNAEVYAREWADSGEPIQVGMMPFFSGNEPGSDFLLSVPQYYIGINSNLEKEGCEDKLALVKNILSWLSTAEGQKAVTDPESTAMSSIKDIPWKNTAFFEAVENTIEEGRLVPVPNLSRTSVLSVEEYLISTLPQLLSENVSIQQFTADLDRASSIIDSDFSEDEIIGQAEESFSVLQLTQLMADIFRERADAQIGLCQANSRRSGIGIQLYKGDLVYNFKETKLDWRLNHGFLSSNNNESSPVLMRARMTGSSLMTVLNSSVRQDPAFWVASGMKITFAPWAQDGNRIISATLSDGSPIDPEAEYTVAIWENTISDDLILEKEAFFEDTIADLFRSRVEQTGSIRPQWDDDFILDWSIVEP